MSDPEERFADEVPCLHRYLLVPFAGARMRGCAGPGGSAEQDRTGQAKEKGVVVVVVV